MSYRWIIVIRLVYSLLGGTVLAFVYRRSLLAEGRRDHEAFSPIAPPMALAAGCLLLPLVCLLFEREGILNTPLNVLTGSAVYYSVLALAVPRLRKRFAARTCALLWLLPNAFWEFILLFGNRTLGHPLLVIPLRFSLRSAAWIWLGVSAVILAYQWIGHLRFRRFLVRNSRPAAEQAADMWNAAQEESRDLNERDWMPMPLYVCPSVRTPVSVGLFRWTTFLVLPEREYTNRELAMIFRHELIHIYRRDAQTKMVIGALEAMLWFVPMIWLTSRRCEEDIELCCDEYAVQGMDDNERAEYGELLLETAGDERGFSTCLSASAESLRYRLANVTRKASKPAGYILLGAVTAAVLFLSGIVTVGYAPQTLQDAAGGYDPEVWTGTAVEYDDEGLSKLMEGIPAEDVWNAIRRCEVMRVAGSFYGNTGADVWFGLPNGVWISINGEYVRLNTSLQLYKLTDLPGWEEIRRIAAGE